MAAKLTQPRTYDHAGWLAVLGDRPSVRIGHNTTLERITHEDGTISVAVRLHWTNVVTFHPDGTVTLDSGGWQSVTTRARMNAVLPQRVHVSQERFVWYVTVRAVREPYEDGMTLDLSYADADS